MDRPHKQQVKGSWKMLKGRLREVWGGFRRNEMERCKGKKDQVVGYITFKTGQTRSRVNKIAEEVGHRF
jgi:uncharacterized protein YjbJ (UPF0337 family)